MSELDNNNYSNLIKYESEYRNIIDNRTLNLYYHNDSKCVTLNLNKINNLNYIDIIKYICIKKFNITEEKLNEIGIVVYGKYYDLTEMPYDIIESNQDTGIIYYIYLKK